MRVLLAGFEPFAGAARNPSALLVKVLANDPPPGVAVAVAVLPVVYAAAWPMLAQAVALEAPDLMLLTGLAGGRAGLSVERVALNFDDSRIADNAGEQRCEGTIVADGPAAYFCTVPVRKMVEAMRASGVPAEASLSAGSFLCNHVLYRALHHADRSATAMRCGFVHLPWLPEQAATEPGAASLTLDEMCLGVRAGLAAAANPRRGEPLLA
jgi:pyroglutamyl-peptidase